MSAAAAVCPLQHLTLASQRGEHTIRCQHFTLKKGATSDREAEGMTCGALSTLLAPWLDQGALPQHIWCRQAMPSCLSLQLVGPQSVAVSALLACTALTVSDTIR